MTPKAIVLDRIKQIDHDLSIELDSIHSPSLMNGLGGSVLFYVNGYTALRNEAMANKARQLVDKLIDELQANEVTHSYCDGITGVGYLLSYLSETDLLDVDVDEFLEDVDKHVLNETSFIISKYRDLDFLHGGLGMGIYLLSRYPKNPPLRRLINEVLDQLIDLIDHDIMGSLPVNLIMNAISPGASPARFFNLGMAHGASAYLVFLARYLTQFPGHPRALDVMSRLVNYIKTFYRPATGNEGQEGAFPDIINFGRHGVYRVPLGWCYGDLTLSIGFLMAGEVMDDPALRQFAETIALTTLQRDSLEAAHLSDACFCHGTTSMAQAYRIWYRASGNQAFKKAYEHWITLTLEMGRFSDGIGGYKKFTGTDTGLPGGIPKYDRITGLLDGATGIGLVLTDYLEQDKIDWERFLLWT
ncbi:lanthionine synthetase C family protein [Spirosoma linguale]|uniref:Lanthionine synthetase C family protein n=1 Tax=Spirosoma linguale (strain ATCC 33905 / DSM 74 / LMG 10896 / Claus 1) TaxID=504472 RepID=D2QPM4_SPILD|nr:Lanthionine synthetase C family protein [Spirosoma linguale DSM 74]